MAIKLDKITKNGKAIFLAYDQGIEHGPSDFDEKSCNPEYIMEIAEKGGYTAVILQHGIAEKYYDKRKHKIPLIVKLNGKSRISEVDNLSSQVCSVKRAIKLGASAVGYTIYDGSEFEPTIFKEFGRIVEEAHEYGLPVVAWMYPRGRGIDEGSTEINAYAARIGLELGADIIKVKYNGDYEGLQWIVKVAGRTKVMMAGGPKQDEFGFLSMAKEMIDNGAIGLAVGRNVWQSPHPIILSKALKKIVFDGVSVGEAMKGLK